MQYRRARLPGSSYFFTVNLANRTQGLLIKNIDSLRHAIQTTKEAYPFKTLAYVILPDHLHLIMTLPKNDSNYSLRWSMIKGLFSKQIPYMPSVRQKKLERGIWQNRFWEHFIRNERDLENHINYIHYNPVKHGYVPQASHWKYSSIHYYIQAGILAKEWAYTNPGDTLQCFGE